MSHKTTGLFMGIDLGTSSVKVMITDLRGNEISAAALPYEIYVPRPGFAQQSCDIWRKQTFLAISEAVKKSGLSPDYIKGIGLSGQMHGLVMLDKNNAPLWDCIIHCDSRSVDEVSEITQTPGISDEICMGLMNPIFTGFHLPSLLWVRKNLPDVYEKIHKILLPKDYIRYCLTGEIGGEHTDASATLLYDMKANNWRGSILKKFIINQDILPKIWESHEIAGYITQGAADASGLKRGTPVVFGAGDQAAQALGNGVFKKGVATCNIGTAGQIFTPVDNPVFNPALNTNMFRHAPENLWFVMGAILSAGLAAHWFGKNILNRGDFSDLEKMAGDAPLTLEGPFFLPYLAGERTPIMDPEAKGVFFGLHMSHTKEDMTRAVMEGVVFALREALELVEGLCGPIKSMIASGGGAQSGIWRQMQADIFNREIRAASSSMQANLGAIVMAAVGTGAFGTYEEACGLMAPADDKVFWPDKKNTSLYEERYSVYKDTRLRLYS